MADKWPLANGNWSNAANWNDGTKPQSGDDVYADGKILTIDENVNIGTGTLRTSQRTGGTTGGSYSVTASGLSITANMDFLSTGLTYSGTGLLTITGNLLYRGAGVTNSSSGTLTLIGNVSGLNTGYINIYGLVNSSTGTVNVIGNVTGGTTNSGRSVVNSNASGTINVTGTLNAGATGNNTNAVYLDAGTANITGNCFGGGSVAGNTCSAVTNNGGGVVTINGNVTGGPGVDAKGVINSSSGTVIITGNATGGSGSTAYGASNQSIGVLRVYGAAIGNDHGLGFSTNNGNAGVFGYGINTGTVQATTTVRAIQYGAKGQSPTIGLVQLDTTVLANSFAKFRTAPTSFTEYTFGPPENIGGQPAASNVRLGTVYNFGNTTGTCAVPPSGSVALGVPVDNTTGTAILTAADFNNILSSALQPNGPIVVERSKEDTNGITFSWPVSGATISGQVSKNNGAYVNTAGAITFLRTDGTRHYYILAYNAADRPAAEGTARYKLTDGTYTKYFTLRVEPSYVANVSVTPGFVTQEDIPNKNNLEIFTSEQDNITVNIYESDGYTPLSLTGVTPEFRVSDLNDILLYTITSGNITVGGPDNNQITFAKTLLTTDDFEGKWSLRDMATNAKVLSTGRFKVTYAP